jgi:diguanylate cyclase (GGDEF)-like protein
MKNLNKNYLSQEYFKNEMIQIYIRIIFVLATVFVLYFYKKTYPNEIGCSFSYLVIAPFFVIVYNLLYALFIKKFPSVLQEERILLAVCVDISMTAYVMYLAGPFSAYYAGVFLWFSVAYGMRYSKHIAYTAYILVIIIWLVIMFQSEFWIKNRLFAIGWLLAYIVLPLYYFKLVQKLQNSLRELHIYADESSYKASHDQLTGAPNRIQFNSDLKCFIEEVDSKGEKFALFFTDLDGFKSVNDRYGHDIGDVVLIEAFKRLEYVLSKSYRLGGDEFVSIVKYKQESELLEYANDLIHILSMPCDKLEISLAGSIGIACFPEDAKSEYDIKKGADMAMYRAKQLGKNRYCFYRELKKSVL